MKLMIASDIHGSAYFCRLLLEACDREQADRLLLLGDLLYHGPRNDLPRDYDTKQVMALLNGRKNQLLCVRGNCDTEVDQMVLDFPMLADYAVVLESGVVMYATHGHKFNPDNPLPMPEGGILLNGHTHVPKCIEYDSYVYMNPGSVSIPKEGSWHGYMTLENGVFLWKDLEDKEAFREKMRYELAKKI